MAGPDELLSIGTVARRAGVASSALRYYEEQGLIAPTTRVNGRRRFTPATVSKVGVILFLAEVGFSIAEIRELLTGRAESPHAWRRLAQEKVAELEDMAAKAAAARTAIEHALDCPEEDLLECPEFWDVVGPRLAGPTGAGS